MTCIVFAIILAFLVIALVMIVMSYYARGSFISSQASNVDYGPGDTQNLFFSSLFCEELETDKNTLYPKGFEESSLYLLKKTPSLSIEKQFSFSGLFDETYKRNFHFYAGSKVTVDACTRSTSDDRNFGSFYLIKGKSTYYDWLSGSEDANKNTVTFLHVTNVCSKDGVEQVKFTVREEDQYYLIFSSSNKSKSMAAISANVSVQRKLYSFDSSSVMEHCQFNTQSCSIKVPFQASTFVLLLYGEPLDWESNWSNSSITILCKARMWFYMLLVVLGTLLVAIVTVAGCVACYCCAGTNNKDETTTPLLSSRTGTLYSAAVPVEKEMHNPSKYSQDVTGEAFKSGGTPVEVSRQSRVPLENYQPPSFRENSVGLGTPSFSTFTTD